MTISRRNFSKAGIAACGAAGLFGTYIKSARAAEFNFKLAHTAPPNHPIDKAAKTAAAEILDKTAGRVEIKIFPAGQLGSDTELLGQVRSGAVELHLGTGVVMTTLVPTMALSGMPFAFSDYPSVWKAMDGSLGAYLRENISKARLHCTPKFWDAGFRIIATVNKPVNTPADLRQVKIRVPASPIEVDMFRAFNASPLSMNVSETYTAMQTGAIDGLTTSVLALELRKFSEVAKVASLTNHLWDTYMVLANQSAWNRLPKNLQVIVDNAFDAAAVVQRKESEESDVTVMKNLSAKGIKFLNPNIAEFQKVLANSGIYRDWRRKLGEDAWAKLTTYAPGLA